MLLFLLVSEQVSNFAYSFVAADFFSKSTFSKKNFRNTIRVSYSLDPDQAPHFVGPDLSPNCLQRLSADNTSIHRVKQGIGVHSSFDATLCTETVETLIRCHRMWHLIWVCTVCLYPTGLYRLCTSHLYPLLPHIWGWAGIVTLHFSEP